MKGRKIVGEVMRADATEDRMLAMSMIESDRLTTRGERE
jgi:hypothetical protein